MKWVAGGGQPWSADSLVLPDGLRRRPQIAGRDSFRCTGRCCHKLFLRPALIRGAMRRFLRLVSRAWPPVAGWDFEALFEDDRGRRGRSAVEAEAAAKS